MAFDTGAIPTENKFPSRPKIWTAKLKPSIVLEGVVTEAIWSQGPRPSFTVPWAPHSLPTRHVRSLCTTAERSRAHAVAHGRGSRRGSRRGVVSVPRSVSVGGVRPGAWTGGGHVLPEALALAKGLPREQSRPDAPCCAQEVVVLDQERYPEHILHLFIINAPRVFAVGWGMLWPLVNERTQRKICVWRTNYLQDLQQHIPLDQIPADFGGTGGHFEPLVPGPAAGRGAGPEPEPGSPLALSPAHPSPPPARRGASPPVQTPRSASPRDSSASFAETSLRTARSAHVLPDPDASEESLRTAWESVARSTLVPGDLHGSEASLCTAREADDDDDGGRRSAAASASAHASPAGPADLRWAPQSRFVPSPDLYGNPPLRLAGATDPAGHATLQGLLGHRPLAETRHNLVLRPGGGRILAELRPGPRGLTLHDAAGAALFRLRRGRGRREVSIFVCGRRVGPAAGVAPRGDASAASPSVGAQAHARAAPSTAAAAGAARSEAPAPGAAPRGSPAVRSLQTPALRRADVAVARQELMYILSCRPVKDGDVREWVVTAPGRLPWAMLRRGDQVLWGGTLRGLDPELLFALAVGLMRLWARGGVDWARPWGCLADQGRRPRGADVVVPGVGVLERGGRRLAVGPPGGGGGGGGDSEEETGIRGGEAVGERGRVGAVAGGEGPWGPGEGLCACNW